VIVEDGQDFVYEGSKELLLLHNDLNSLYEYKVQIIKSNRMDLSEDLYDIFAPEKYYMMMLEADVTGEPLRIQRRENFRVAVATDIFIETAADEPPNMSVRAGTDSINIDKMVEKGSLFRAKTADLSAGGVSFTSSKLFTAGQYLQGYLLAGKILLPVVCRVVKYLKSKDGGYLISCAFYNTGQTIPQIYKFVLDLERQKIQAKR
jgi:c-di-GMP-binding flagellar brake protein YcgR